MRLPPAIEYVTAEAGSDPCRFLAGADVLVVDPPRKGLGASLLEALTATPAQAGGAAGTTAQPVPGACGRAAPTALPPQPGGAAGNDTGMAAQSGGSDTPSEQHGHEGEQWLEGLQGQGHKTARSPALLPSRLVYLSCGFRALQHDLGVLLGAGWALRSATAFLFFPGTDALETLVLLTRGDEGEGVA